MLGVDLPDRNRARLRRDYNVSSFVEFFALMTCSDLVSSTNATAGFTTEQKDVSQRLLWPVFFEKVTTVEDWAASLGKE